MKWIYILLMIMAFALGASKCDNDGCQPEELRCDRDQVQICNAGQRWELVVDCSELEPGEHTCVDPGDDTGNDTDTEDEEPECVEE